MKLTELRDEIDRIVNEFGDGEAYSPDPLEPQWRRKITGVEYEHDRQQAVITSDGD